MTLPFLLLFLNFALMLFSHLISHLSLIFYSLTHYAFSYYSLHFAHSFLRLLLLAVSNILHIYFCHFYSGTFYYIIAY